MPTALKKEIQQLQSGRQRDVEAHIEKGGQQRSAMSLKVAIRPQEIAREAEELMKEFSENEEFVELMRAADRDVEAHIESPAQKGRASKVWEVQEGL